MKINKASYSCEFSMEAGERIDLRRVKRVALRLYIRNCLRDGRVPFSVTCGIRDVPWLFTTSIVITGWTLGIKWLSK